MCWWSDYVNVSEASVCQKLSETVLCAASLCELSFVVQGIQFLSSVQPGWASGLDRSVFNMLYLRVHSYINKYYVAAFHLSDVIYKIAKYVGPIM